MRAAGDGARPGAPAPTTVAYVMSRFPKLTETFILDEMLEMQRQGVAVAVYPLRRERASVVHEDVKQLTGYIDDQGLLNVVILIDNLRLLLRRPGRYLSTLLTLVTANCRSARYLAGALAAFPKAVSWARRMPERGISHVHAHFASHPAAVGFVITRLAPLPFSFTAHGSDLHREQAMLKQKVEASRFAVAISDYNRRFMLQRVGQTHADRVHVVHCGVDLQHFAPATGSEAFNLVCIGTLHAVKGQGPLIDACARLKKKGVNFRCHLVGDGPDRAALARQAATLGLSDRVVFHGALDRNAVRRLLVTMDAAVQPSVPTADGRREGIPVALMEAAACGLPLVASRLSGIPELVKDGQNGLLVSPGDAAGLADALAQLAETPDLRARYGRAARACVEQEFDLASSVTRLRALMVVERAAA